MEEGEQGYLCLFLFCIVGVLVHVPGDEMGAGGRYSILCMAVVVWLVQGEGVSVFRWF